MTEKEMNAKTAELIATSAFWQCEIFCRHFTEECTMGIPTAPPGMPNHFSTWEMERCFEWLNRSVRKYKATISDFYPTPDPELFWVVGNFILDAFWGDQDGHMESMFFLKIKFDHLKVTSLSWRFDSAAMLEAAGKRAHKCILELPRDKEGNIDTFDQDWILDLNSKDVEEYLSHPSFGEIPVGQDKSDFSSDPAEIAKRRQINIYQFASGVDRDKYRILESLNEEYQKTAYFVGDLDFSSSDDSAAMEKLKRAFAWNKVCSPWMYRDPRSKFYPTDDPNVYFVEMNAHGPGCWSPNSKGPDTGHYHQDYLVRLVLDDLGRLVRFEEIVNGLKMLESIGADIPNFPYYH